MRTSRADLMAGARIVGVISIVLVAGLASRRTEGMDRGASTPRTHMVSVGADGTFSPDFLYVSDGDTVEWRLHDRTDTIIPAQSNEPFPAICSGQKPYDATDPNEFTGPMPQWPSGIFTLGPDDKGLVVVANAADCPTQVVVAAGGQFLCRSGAESATMEWTWQNPNLTGVFVRLQWKDVHKGPGNFDWRILDRELDQAVQNGKLYSLAFKAGSDGTPNWIFDDPAAPVRRLTFQDIGDEEACESPPCCGVRMDLGSPADLNFRKHYFDLLTAAAAHVKSRNDWFRALAYIKPSGMNLFTHENRLPRNCQCGCSICNSEVWATQGNYTPAALYEFYRLQTELMVASFPEKRMSYALIQNGFPLVNGPTEYETCEAGKPASPGGTEQTEQILRTGRMLHGLDFVVQHQRSTDSATGPHAAAARLPRRGSAPERGTLRLARGVPESMGAP